MAKHGYYISVS